MRKGSGGCHRSCGGWDGKKRSTMLRLSAGYAQATLVVTNCWKQIMHKSYGLLHVLCLSTCVKGYNSKRAGSGLPSESSNFGVAFPLIDIVYLHARQRHMCSLLRPPSFGGWHGAWGCAAFPRLGPYHARTRPLSFPKKWWETICSCNPSFSATKGAKKRGLPYIRCT